MAKVHDRILEVVFVADDSAETVVVSAVNYYRDRSALPSSGFPVTFSQTSPNTTGTELVFGELVPPPTHMLLTFTVQA
jgi:hypothetical protein